MGEEKNITIIVPPEKLREYLLSETHPVGKSKAKFFRSLGFNETNIEDFIEGLLSIARSDKVDKVMSTKYGVKYIIDGIIHTPIGSIVKIRTIWIVEKGLGYKRFITAYPI